MYKRQVESRLEYVREGLAAQLTDLKTGLEASAATAGNQANAVDSAIAAIDEVLAVATNNDTIDLDVTAAVKEMGQEVAALAPGAAPAEDAAAEDLF